MRKFNRKKYMMYGEKWYGEVNDLYKATHSLNKNFSVVVLFDLHNMKTTIKRRWIEWVGDVFVHCIKLVKLRF